MLDLRSDFPLLSRTVAGKPIVYLDSAATSLKPQCVIDAVGSFYSQHTSNVHRAVYLLAEEATELYEGARTDLARLLGSDASELVFVRGSTEAINLLRHCYPGLERVLISSMEHHSNFLPWAYGEGSCIVPVDEEGRIDLDAFDAALARGVDLVAIAHVSNALGVINPVEEIIGRAHAAGALVLLDAAQSVPHLAVDVKALDVDFLALSAHKMLGPGGVGALYGKAEHLERMEPWLLGGHCIDQVHMDSYSLLAAPHRFEAGTPAIEATIGWGAAVGYLRDLGMDQVAAHDRELVRYARQRLGDIDHLQLTGPSELERSCAAVAFRVEGLEAHGVARMLSNRANIYVRSGFHCAQPLHESLELLPTVRASFYVYNDKSDVDTLANCLTSIVEII